MKQRDWKILYGSASLPVEQRTIELLSTGNGNRIQRDFGMYSLYLIACAQALQAYREILRRVLHCPCLHV